MVDPGAPAIATLAETLAALQSLGQEEAPEYLDVYADAVEWLAEREVASVISDSGPDKIAENVVVGTILGLRLIAALRLLAHEHFSSGFMAGHERLGHGIPDATTAGPGDEPPAGPASCSE